MACEAAATLRTSQTRTRAGLSYRCQLKFRQVLHKLRTVWPFELICVQMAARRKVCLERLQKGMRARSRQHLQSKV